MKFFVLFPAQYILWEMPEGLERYSMKKHSTLPHFLVLQKFTKG